MDLLARAAAEGRPVDLSALLKSIPYCAHLGIDARASGDAVTLVMPFQPHQIGNVVLPAIHGGVIGSLLETAAIIQVIWEMGTVHVPKPVDISIDYLRSARAVDSYARATLFKQGRRVVNVHALMWQDDEHKPVASLRGHFLVGAPEKETAPR